MPSKSTLNFQPVVNFGGPATPEAVGQMQENLRELADEFLEKWNDATEQARRLAFG